MADAKQQSYIHNRYRQLWGSHCLWKGLAGASHHAVSVPKTRHVHGSPQRNSPFQTVALHSLMPVVHAKELDSDLVGGSDGLTVSQRVAQCRPKILVTDKDVEDYLATETGLDRLRAMVSKQDDKYSPEIQLVTDSSSMCALMTFAVTSVKGGMMAREEFLEKNQHTKFPSRYRAVKACNDAVVLGGMKFGGKWALKTGLFTATFIGLSQGIAVYRNKSSVLEYIAAGAVTGGLTRYNLGLRGFVAGSIIGAVLGTVGGVVMFSVMKLGNETQERRHYMMVHSTLRENREMEILAQGTPTMSEPTPATG